MSTVSWQKVTLGLGQQYTAGSNQTVVATGGDSVWIGTYGTLPNVEVDASGNNNIIANGGIDTIFSSTGNTSLQVGESLVTVEASGNAALTATFAPWTAGQLDFINNSSQASTVLGSYGGNANGTGAYASNSVTAFGGAGGGLYIGGHGGRNLLVGQSGKVTLEGANSGDVLSVTGGNGDVLYSGGGAETLVAGSGSTNDTFFLNHSNPGSPTITGADLVVSNGSGIQSFVMEAGFSTITGSQASGALNIFDLVRSESVGSANYTITNFSKINGVMFITDPSLVAGNSQVNSVQTLGGNTTVTLNDQSTIKFIGVSGAQLHVSSLAHGIIAITG